MRAVFIHSLDEFEGYLILILPLLKFKCKDEAVFLKSDEVEVVNHTLLYDLSDSHEEDNSWRNVDLINGSDSLLRLDDASEEEKHEKPQQRSTDSLRLRDTQLNTGEIEEHSDVRLDTIYEENIQDLFIDESIAMKIQELLIRFKTRQDEIDAGNFTPRGPGRRRVHERLSTLRLEELVSEYLRRCIRECSDYNTGDGRKDALITFFIRAIKKVCYNTFKFN